MKRNNFLLFLLLLICTSVSAQYAKEGEKTEYISDLNLGLGLGLDYGGIGVRLTYLPDPKLMVFAAGGFNIVGAGYNIGASYKFNPKSKLQFYYTLMYGYNAVIQIMNASQFDKIYYGVSTGGGMELHLKRKKNNYFNFELLVPIRSQKYRDDYYDITHNPNIEVIDAEVPVTISVGYHFPL